jgi:mRNA-degrading endonuclease RelE of RelBE toxin-antitoxin system
MSKYQIYITPGALQEVQNPPGTMRERVKRAIDLLGDNPYPSLSKELEFDILFCKLRRLQIDRWRITYLIHEDDKVIDILGVRKRPPQDFGDFNTLLEELK